MTNLQNDLDKFEASMHEKLAGFKRLYPNLDLVLVEGSLTDEFMNKALFHWEIVNRVDKKDELVRKTWLMKADDARAAGLLS